MTLPEKALPLTVAIISHNRPVLCSDAVRSVLATAEAWPGPCTLRVYDSSGAPARIEDPRVTVRHCPELPGVLGKRKLAEAECDTEWLIYMDDDCRMLPNALAAFGGAVADANANVAAFICNTRFVGDRGFWFRCLEGTDYFSDFQQCKRLEPVPWGPTALSAFRVPALRRCGAFDMLMGTRTGGEDVHACLVLREFGSVIMGIPQELVEHNTETWNSFSANARRAFNYGQGDAELCRIWPRHRLWDPGAPMLVFAVLLLAADGIAAAHPVDRVWIGVAILVFVGANFLSLVLREWTAHPGKKLAELLGFCLLRLYYQGGGIRMRLVNPDPTLLVKRFDWTWAWSLTNQNGRVFAWSQLGPWLSMLASLGAMLFLATVGNG